MAKRRSFEEHAEAYLASENAEWEVQLDHHRRLKKIAQERLDNPGIRIRPADEDGPLIREFMVALQDERRERHIAALTKKLARTPPSQRLSDEDKKAREDVALRILGQRRYRSVNEMVLKIVAGRGQDRTLPLSERALRTLVVGSARLSALLTKPPRKK